MSRRQSTRLNKPPASPSPETTTTTASVETPIFSANVSVSSQSDAEDDLLLSSKAAGKKRKGVGESVGTRSSKRRVSEKLVYVEVSRPAKGGIATKGGDDSEEEQAPPPRRKVNKGKGRAPAPEVSSDEEVLVRRVTRGKRKARGSSDDDEPMEDSAGSSFENPPSESEGSGSEFEGSESDMDASEEEALVVAAAIKESLADLDDDDDDSNGAGSSKQSRARPSVDAVAVRKARKTEKRFTRRTSTAKDFEVLSDAPLEELSTSDSEPLAGNTKKKGAARRGKNKEWAEHERKLGRKLTHAEKTTISLQKQHPELKDVWGDLKAKIPIIKPERAEQPANLKVKLLPFQQESLYWMRKQEEGEWKGGILADEMGMGKTIQIISLFVSDLKRPNLVIAPTVAVMQWKNEIAAHTEGIDVLVWHGQARESNVKELQKHDVVITTYAVAESCYRKQEYGFKRKGDIVKAKSPLHQIKWNRIVLDEAHNIKERSTNTAKAAFALNSSFKWCLSGTPLQNRVGELYSLVRFLGGDPFSYYFCKLCPCKSLHWKFINYKECKECGHNPMQHTCLWNNEILTPIQKHGMIGPGADAFKRLRILLDRMMLRRTKVQRADDLGLPPRTVIIRRDYFSPEEKELYLSLFSDAKRQFSTYLDQGTVLNNYSNIFSLLTRMRQMACHPDLVLRSKTNQSQFVQDEGEATVCRLCNDIAEDAIQSKCRHIFDRECIKQYLNTAMEQVPACPVCHLPLTIDLEAPAMDLENNFTARQGILGRLNLDSWRSSTKIEALLEILSNLRQQDATTKTIVFSQFVNFLDLIAFRLQRAGFKICRLEGTMSPQARDATIQHFMTNVDVTVFLVSLKAGGVALNLTEASRVILCDSWWNPAVEFQAMDRIHRLGQKRPVEAIKLVVEDSIESRIIQLQEKKSAMVDATLSTDDSAMGRLTPEDLSFLFRL